MAPTRSGPEADEIDEQAEHRRGDRPEARAHPRMQHGDRRPDEYRADRARKE
jgi:hypothetical protein